MDEVGVALFLGDLCQQLLLVLDAVAVALEVIVAREAFVQERLSREFYRLSFSCFPPFPAANGKWHS